MKPYIDPINNRIKKSDENKDAPEPQKIPLSRIVNAVFANDKSNPFFYKYKKANASVASL